MFILNLLGYIEYSMFTAIAIYDTYRDYKNKRLSRMEILTGIWVVLMFIALSILFVIHEFKIF